MNWTTDENGCHTLTVPCFTHEAGRYHIVIQKRPSYCDRGDWIIYVHGLDIDGADGFPRYFFGTEDQVKAQMETWLQRRAAFRKANAA